MSVAPPAPAASGSLAPLQLPWDLQLTPEQFEQVCQANPDAVLELAADGHLIAMTPTGGETGQRNQTLGALLWLAVRQSGLPLKLFDSSTGFRLPDGSVLSPDAALVRLESWQALTLDQRRGFPPLCPDLVVELASPSDEGPRGVCALRQKMELFRRNGARLGWLLFPAVQAVEIWHGDCGTPPERLQPADQLDASELFPGLRVELSEVWQG
ncbi:Uma2 family endonuclease [Synechococcus sp. CS-1329]|uniref:Uma2 family endonuclease n=1 Tax=Synechococcus sp. CS-1329 TaxID=2847975 RepID=UPI00223AF19A|nr:Uma2 family endonuclease [Synechococcus sp. CS-1329]MCT0219809.1 Uma2 family endonuclease [Synechococcus sp. CS-1329]